MSYRARVKAEGITLSVGRYETKARADIARKLCKYWLKQGYLLSELNTDKHTSTVRSNQYMAMPGMNHIAIRVKPDLTLSFGYRFHSGRKYYSMYGYDSLAKAVHSRDNARKQLGLMIEG